MRKIEHNRFFTRLLPERRSQRSFIWLVGMLLVVLGLIIYLNRIASTG